LADLSMAMLDIAGQYFLVSKVPRLSVVVERRAYVM